MEDKEVKYSSASEDTAEYSFYFSDFWRGLIKFWWVLVAAAVIFATIFFYKAYLDYVPSYSVSCTFAVNTDSSNSLYASSYNSAVAQEISSTFDNFLSTNILQDSICNDLGIDYVPAEISASSVTDTNMVVMTASGSDPQMTYDVMVSAIENYPSIARYIFGNTEITMITEPYVPSVPTNKYAYRKNALYGAGVGILVGLIWLAIYVVFRKTIRTRRDVHEKLGITTLGVLPQVFFKVYNREIDRSILMNNASIGNGFLEALRVLRNTLLHSLKRDDKIIVITSTAPGEGKSTIAVNIAASFAEAGKNVLLIDGDIRNPSVYKILNYDVQFENKEEAYKLFKDEKTGISFLTFNFANKRRQWKIMREEYLSEFVQPFIDKYDYIIFDTPPCGLISDSSIVAQIADVAVYVVLQDVVRASRIKSSLSNFAASGVRIAGCVLNGAMSGISGYGENYGYKYNSYYRYKIYNGYYRYGYYNGYGYQSKSDDEPKKEKKTEKKK